MYWSHMKDWENIYKIILSYYYDWNIRVTPKVMESILGGGDKNIPVAEM